MGYASRMPTAKKMGRPEGRAYPHVRSIRLGDRDVERLEKLAAKLELPEVQVVRTAIRKLAESEGVDQP